MKKLNFILSVLFFTISLVGMQVEKKSKTAPSTNRVLRTSVSVLSGAIVTTALYSAFPKCFLNSYLKKTDT